MRFFKAITSVALDIVLVLAVFTAGNLIARRAATQLQQNATVQSKFDFRNLMPTQAQDQVDTGVSAVADKVMPSVVSLYGYDQQQDPFGFTSVVAGSGFFITQDGYIITNKHVVADTSADYFVVLSSGKRRVADVVYRDPDNDIAVVKISGTGYTSVTLGDSSALTRGETVFGVGNAFGAATSTVSAGQVAALHRSLTAIAEDDSQQPEALKNLIQISAQLYPGDSGGPLFDANGTVVGIDVAISAQHANESFSIPINDARDIIDQYVVSGQ